MTIAANPSLAVVWHFVRRLFIVQYYTQYTTVNVALKIRTHIIATLSGWENLALTHDKRQITQPNSIAVRAHFHTTHFRVSYSVTNRNEACPTHPQPLDDVKCLHVWCKWGVNVGVCVVCVLSGDVECVCRSACVTHIWYYVRTWTEADRFNFLSVGEHTSNAFVCMLFCTLYVYAFENSRSLRGTYSVCGVTIWCRCCAHSQTNVTLL